MKYATREALSRANLFGTGEETPWYAKHTLGAFHHRPLSTPVPCPLPLHSLVVEPAARTHWRCLPGKEGGQLLLCVAGQGWYQVKGSRPTALAEGSVVWIAPGTDHWFGAAHDSWCGVVLVDHDPDPATPLWGEAVPGVTFAALPTQPPHATGLGPLPTPQAFRAANAFGRGIYNFPFRAYFSGRSYLKMLLWPWVSSLLPMNVSSEPTCRNHWHVHHAAGGGGQLLLCTAGTGWVRLQDQPAVPLQPGSAFYIPAEVAHWHGASADSWFSHIAINLPGEGQRNAWLGPVEEEAYRALHPCSANA